MKTATGELHGLHSDRRHLRCWLGEDRNERGALEKALKAIKRKKNNPVYTGALLSLLGDFAAAEKALNDAIATNPRDSQAWALRGELHVVQGHSEQATADLNAAIALDANNPWPCIYRGALRFQHGDLRGCASDIDAFSRLRPQSPIGTVLHSIIAAQNGDSAKAQDLLSDALKASSAGWIYALRGRMRATQEDLPGAREDLDRAVRTEKSPWLRAERAEILNRLGDFVQAIAEYKRIAAALPHNPEPLARLGAIHLQQARFSMALRFFNGAIRLAPENCQYYFERAQLYFIKGEREKALVDYAKAAALAPESEHYRQHHVRLLILCGHEKTALKLLKSAPLPPGAAAFWEGYLRCRQGRFQESSRFFAKAEKEAAGVNGDIHSRARNYRFTASMLSQMPPAEKVPGKVIRIMGLGYRQPDQITGEALRDLWSCETIYSNLSDPTIIDFLGLFPVTMKAIVFRRQHVQAHHASIDVMPGVGKYKRVGVVTRANPLYYGRMANRVAVRGKAKKGAAAFCASSISIAEIISCLIGDPSGGGTGYEMRDSIDLKELNPQAPLVIYNLPSAPKERRQRLAPLIKLYPNGHPCWLLAGWGDMEYTPVRQTLDAFDEALDKADPAVTLYIPGIG
jgi:tetratricopeptide (TPR) repeat protein